MATIDKEPSNKLLPQIPYFKRNLLFYKAPNLNYIYPLNLKNVAVKTTTITTRTIYDIYGKEKTVSIILLDSAVSPYVQMQQTVCTGTFIYYIGSEISLSDDEIHEMRKYIMNSSNLVQDLKSPVEQFMTTQTIKPIKVFDGKVTLSSLCQIYGTFILYSFDEIKMFYDNIKLSENNRLVSFEQTPITYADFGRRFETPTIGVQYIPDGQSFLFSMAPVSNSPNINLIYYSASLYRTSLFSGYFSHDDYPDVVFNLLTIAPIVSEKPFTTNKVTKIHKNIHFRRIFQGICSKLGFHKIVNGEHCYFSRDNLGNILSFGNILDEELANVQYYI